MVSFYSLSFSVLSAFFCDDDDVDDMKQSEREFREKILLFFCFFEFLLTKRREREREREFREKCV